MPRLSCCVLALSATRNSQLVIQNPPIAARLRQPAPITKTRFAPPPNPNNTYFMYARAYLHCLTHSPRSPLPLRVRHSLLPILPSAFVPRPAPSYYLVFLSYHVSSSESCPFPKSLISPPHKNETLETLDSAPSIPRALDPSAPRPLPPCPKHSDNQQVQEGGVQKMIMLKSKRPRRPFFGPRIPPCKPWPTPAPGAPVTAPPPPHAPPAGTACPAPPARTPPRISAAESARRSTPAGSSPGSRAS